MSDNLNFSCKARYLKCFGENAQGFDSFKPINIIIGRNNSGKSTLLDMLAVAIPNKSDIPVELHHRRNESVLLFETIAVEEQLRRVFPTTTAGGGIPTNTHWAFGEKLVGRKVSWLRRSNSEREYLGISSDPDGRDPFAIVQQPDKYRKMLVDTIVHPFEGQTFRRLRSERDIRREPHAGGDVSLNEDGSGATDLLQCFLNKANLPSELVEEKLLGDLNFVFGPDVTFRDIVCQQLENNAWEIFLNEKLKGQIPLSQSGSGLKTVILVLIHMNLVPHIDGARLENYIFGFEELENNLHPALHRRLLAYIKNKAKNNGCTFVITSHSNVSIDMFSTDADAQILHVTHDGKAATVKSVRTYVENKGVLDDLDVRASDLLQSNGIIWVEGPSDRIYVNRWIFLLTNGDLTEGIHYQCMFYGGRLLAHLSSDDPSFVNDSISLLRLNRNAIMLIDSDKKNKESQLGHTKKRIIEEIANFGGVSWVTKGREIENYISAKSVSAWQEQEDAGELGQYDDFYQYLNEFKPKLGDRYVRKKVVLAEELCPFISEEDLRGVLDLSDRLNEACDAIRNWNGIVD